MDCVLKMSFLDNIKVVGAIPKKWERGIDLLRFGKVSHLFFQIASMEHIKEILSTFLSNPQ